MSDANHLALAARLRALTPARVGLDRTGVSQQTRDLLDFQRSHAMARDAVHAQLQAAVLAAALREISVAEVHLLHSAAKDRATYLQRPDLGRTLDAASRDLLTALHPSACDLAIVVADGLSALAVERHALPLLSELLPQLSSLSLAPVCVVEQGRVAIADEIGSALGAQLTVILIGERPGLSSPDSLGAYITWQPKPGRADAERNCISNIRAEGLSYIQAAAQISFYIAEAQRRQLSGIALKDESNLLAGQAPRTIQQKEIQ
jgi:ethanolamine ammonia-lyase small subunit